MKKYTLRVIYALSLCLAAAFLALVYVSDRRQDDMNQSRLRRAEFQGTFRVGEDETARELTEEKLSLAGAAESLTMTGHFTEDIEENEQVFFYLRRIRVELYQNGELIYACGGPDSHFPLLRSSGNVWGNFYSPGITSDDDITVRFYNPYPGNSSQIYALWLQRLYVGDKMQLFWHMAGKNMPTVFISTLIFLMGIELLFLALSLKALRIQGMGRVFHCGLLFVTSSLWLLIDYSYVSLLFPYGRTVDILDTLAFIGIPPLAVHYARDYMSGRLCRRMELLECALMIGNAAYLLLQWAGRVDGELMQELCRKSLPVVVVLIFAGLVSGIRKNRKLDDRLVLLSGIILIFFGLGGYIWYEISGIHGVSLFGIGLNIFALVQYLLVIRHIWRINQEKMRARQMEQELMESRIAIMLSQIQPHFLYNSISCIQELCLIEPKKAYDALAQFAHFLRGNMDSLSCASPIPFEQELRHVKNYLALEKIRFEDRLAVRYELEEEGFFIPALTIQPIVENAVRYGISKKKQGGTVVISTRRVQDEIIVTVEDDGAGFDAARLSAYPDGRSHVGMENVKNRLMSQCGGRMEVESRIGEGTTVRMILPVWTD